MMPPLQFTPRDRAWLAGVSHGTLGLDADPPANPEMAKVYWAAFIGAGLVRELSVREAERPHDVA